MFIYVGIDGTGTGDTGEYERLFKNSFVNQLGRMGMWEGASIYRRGPTDPGFETASIAASAHSEFLPKYNAIKAANGAKRPRVFMAGYSRGGAAILKVANMLHDADIEVECLLLFDAVDRTTTISSDETKVPPTVRFCRHARRAEAARSRIPFGYCDTPYDPASTDYEEKPFLCTHGGVGGAPWTGEDCLTNGYIDEYKDAKSRIGQWISPVLIGVSLPTRITLGQELIGMQQTQSWAWSALSFSLVRARSEMKAETPDANVPQPGAPGTTPPGATRPPTRTHTVSAGETLSLITKRYWEDMMLFPLLYDANASTIGTNWDRIMPGMQLLVPEKSSFTRQQQDEARRRARAG